ncbi:putative Cell division protein FtsQ [Candidatus Filomicrobium marinum]|uniref:Cell division protein FtsQ n=1 Tax=Candidatus Filomicrobium marinum TaxID=1608628 RepID=A0A0D6JKQ1_9HYPH|nr:putative Cell division protein FtsQ [Candidatus Filomicrobium marinum]CPR22544.1 putative Cell division protein FtsQ [Candidatus Filomicrobium marinum]
MQQVGAFSGLFRSARAASPHSDDAGFLPDYDWPNERARPRRVSVAFRVTSIAIAGLVGIGLFWILTQGGEQTRTMSSVSAELDRVVGWSGFGIDQVTLKGHRFTPDGDVFDALGLDKARSVLSFDFAAARRAVEELSWVERASITRVYPDQMIVEITERVPYALWQHGKDLLIVDREGRVLSAAERHTAPSGLVQIAGEGAAKEASALMALLSAHADLSGALQQAERVAGRRWRLHLVDGNQIELPATGEATALVDLKAWPDFAAVLAAGHSVIDVRTSGRIAVRTLVKEAGTDVEPRSIRELIMRAG